MLWNEGKLFSLFCIVSGIPKHLWYGCLRRAQPMS